jgi:squalene synthase HpnC
VVSGRRADLERAYGWCAHLARRHYENFPVASLLLPAHMRPAIAAIYAFARRADDFADEPGPSAAERIALLDGWQRRLHAPAPAVSAGDDVDDVDDRATPQRRDAGDDLIFVALHDAIHRHSLPTELFDDLLSAFRQDVSTSRYATWSDVLDYCRRSANPVGRLVLRVAGYAERDMDERSDAVCTALQLTNFWQDFGVDWRRGRLYLPEEDRDRAGADEQDLERGRWTASWQTALDAVVGRTRELFVQGRSICDAVPGRLRWELRITWLGGSRILDKVQTSVDALHRRPRLNAADIPLLIGRAVVWR